MKPADTKILVVDDDPDILSGTVRLLAKNGYTVQQAASGEAALSAVATQPPDLLLIDRDLGGIDGLEVCRRIKQMPAYADVLVVIASASYVATENQAEGLEAGADGYIARPISNRELLARVSFYVRVFHLNRALRRQNAELLERAAAASQAQLASLNLMEDALTAQRKTEALNQRLTASINRHEAMVGSINDAIISVDVAGKVIDWNNGAEKIFGYSATEMLGQDLTQIIPDRHHADHLAGMARVMAGGPHHAIGKTVLMEGRRKDGSEFPLELSLSEWRVGEQMFFTAIVHDITKRQQTDDRLRREQALFNDLITTIPDRIYYKDRESRFIRINTSLAKVFGLADPAEAIGKTDRDFFSNEYAEATLLEERRIIRTGEPIIGQIQREQHPSGKSTWVSSTKVALRDNAGQITGLVGISRDITEHKELEEKFYHAQRLENLGMLAAGISHDLNNVLGPIMMTAPLLRPSLATDRDLRILGVLELSAGRAAGLVKQILGFARASSGEFQVIQFKHIARDIISMIEETFPKSIALRHLIPSDLWPTQGSPTQLHQVLLNLCVNARDAMPAGGTLSIQASNRQLNATKAAELPEARPGAWIEIEVSDTGTGIPPDVLESIWEPFYTTKGAGKGTGLGLSTVRGIIASHHGFITLDTEVVRGTTFRVFLPALVNEEEKAGSAIPFAASAGHGEFVLVVDDEKLLRETLTAMLSESGYRVEGCADGAAALEFFTNHRDQISLVVTDLDMPVMGGLDLARTLLQLRPDLPLVAMSGLTPGASVNSNVDEIRKLAQVLFLKPFKAADLLAAIHRLLHPVT